MAVLRPIDERVDLLFAVHFVDVVLNLLAIGSGLLISVDGHGAFAVQSVVDDGIRHGNAGLI